jgi:imidazolonepropionase-like amidohydrolase
MKTLKIYFIALFSICFALNAQQTPAPVQNTTVAIKGATAHLGNGSLLDNSLIIFENGTLQYVGQMDRSKLNTQMDIIEADGKHVYPGFIIPNSTLGLIEIDAVRASDDDEEIGTWNPHIRSLIAYNTESKVVETMRPNGVLMAQITPRGGRISGTSSVV